MFLDENVKTFYKKIASVQKELKISNSSLLFKEIRF